MIKCYQLIEVVCKGEKLQARPVGWDREDYTGFGRDRKGEEVQATQFHTTCPACGNLIDFKLTNLYVGVDKSENNVKCKTCGCGTEVGEEPKELVINTKELAKIKVTKVEVPTFRDPIAEGLFDEDINFEKLEGLDSAKAD